MLQWVLNGASSPSGGGDETGHHIASWADHWSLGCTLCPTPPQSGELRSHEMCQLVSGPPNRVSCQWTIRVGALQSPRSRPVTNWGSGDWTGAGCAAWASVAGRLNTDSGQLVALGTLTKLT